VTWYNYFGNLIVVSADITDEATPRFSGLHSGINEKVPWAAPELPPKRSGGGGRP
jgi:hypothetical protein